MKKFNISEVKLGVEYWKQTDVRRYVWGGSVRSIKKTLLSPKLLDPHVKLLWLWAVRRLAAVSRTSAQGEISKLRTAWWREGHGWRSTERLISFILPFLNLSLLRWGNKRFNINKSPISSLLCLGHFIKHHLSKLDLQALFIEDITVCSPESLSMVLLKTFTKSLSTKDMAAIFRLSINVHRVKLYGTQHLFLLPFFKSRTQIHKTFSIYTNNSFLSKIVCEIWLKRY